MQPKSELSSRKPKEMQGNLLGFPFISLAESGLCSGLQAKKIKKSHLAQLASRVVFETVSGRGSAVNGSIPTEPALDRPAPMLYRRILFLPIKCP
jgi:hypothetical protein